MRYLLIAVLLVAVVTACHAEEAKSTKTEYAVSVDTTKINLGQQVDDVAGALKKHLDGPLGMYYQASVKRNTAMGCICTGFFLLLLITTIVCLVREANSENRFKEASVNGVVALVGGIVVVLLVPLWVASVEMMLAPEYIAMKDIMQSIGTIVK